MTFSGGSPVPDSSDDLVAELALLLGDTDAAERAVAQLRDQLRSEPSPAVAARHLAAMRTAIVDLHELAGSSDGAGAVVDLRARRTRRTVVGTVVAVATLTVTGGLAAAGVLPAPLQDAV